jgi:hypothetical protein
MLIADPKKFADDLGNLHDAWIETMDYSADGEHWRWASAI